VSSLGHYLFFLNQLEKLNLIKNAFSLLEKYPENWKELEIAAMLYLFYQDYSVNTSVIMEGSRGKHKIDVVGTFSQGNIEYETIIECKFWKQKVKKEQVATLASIIEDLGVSKGIIISKHGFQKGALNYAKNRSIELISLDKIMLLIRHTSFYLLTKHYENKVFNLEKRINLYKSREVERFTGSYNFTKNSPEIKEINDHYDYFLEKLEKINNDMEKLILIHSWHNFPKKYKCTILGKKSNNEVKSWDDFFKYIMKDYNFLIKEFEQLRKKFEYISYLV